MWEIEQEVPGVKAARDAWREEQLDLAIDRLVFIVKSGFQAKSVFARSESFSGSARLATWS